MTPHDAIMEPDSCLDQDPQLSPASVGIGRLLDMGFDV
jgi:hypothetical protein